MVTQLPNSLRMTPPSTSQNLPQTPYATYNSITARSVLIGMVAVICQCLATPYNDFHVGGTYLAGNHLPIAVVFVMLVFILGVNTLLKRLKPDTELQGSELLVIWGMMLVASGIPSSGLMRYLVPLAVSPFYFATPENEWITLFHQHLPDWMVVKDPKAVFYFYEQLPDGDRIPWLAWLKPIVGWSAFVLIFYFVTICWTVLLRKQWVEHERFTFPLVQLPMEMFQPPSGSALLNRFFKSPLMWCGFAMPVILHGLKGLHLYFPAIPSPPVYFPIAAFFTEKPLSALNWWPSVNLFIFPSVVAVVYLLTLEISFSFWFFFLLGKMETVLIYATGSKVNQWNFHQNQQMGALLVFIGFILFIGKRHFGRAFATILGRKSSSDTNEPLPYVWAVAGLIGGILLLTLICSLAGMSIWVALFILGIFLAITTVGTWMVTNGGLMFILYSFLPGEYLITLFGSGRVNAPSWTLVAYERVLMFDMREILMPSVMNNFKLAEPLRLKQRPFLLAMGIAIVLAMGVSYYSSLDLAYTHGAVNLQHWTYMISTTSPFNRLTSILQNPIGIELERLGSFIFGGAAMFGMLWMRHHYLWWKLHPIGSLMMTSYATYCFWGSFFIGWFLKYTTLKFGGVAYYRKLRPLILGIVLGECFIGGIWIIVGLMTGIGYRLLPG
ncbi:hypothetical protein F4Z99_12930 [Candidatus Poribacteria bacterium]|nr:hypothetical protein [Candidatus Poribacteria bacterium]